MDFHESGTNEFDAALQNNEGSFTVILAPNFEARSVVCCEDIIERIRVTNVDPRRVHWIVLTLQGSDAKEILDALKAVHARKVLASLEAAGFEKQIQHRVIDYPISHEKFVSEMAVLFRRLHGNRHLIIDFSALPRNLLSSLLKQVSEAGTQGSAFPLIDQVWLFYRWAAEYPEVSGPEFLGELVGHFTHLPLRRLLEHKTHVELVIFTSGTTYDAFNAVELAREAGLGNQTSIHLVNFIHTNNFHESFLNLRNHYGMIKDAHHTGVTVRYAFTVRHALAFMREVAVRCAKLRNQEKLMPLFAIGPFGPKPLAVAAHFVRQEYLMQIRMGSSEIPVVNKYDDADVLNSMGSQYLSPYSLGVSGRTIFRYVPTPGEFL